MLSVKLYLFSVMVLQISLCQNDILACAVMLGVGLTVNYFLPRLCRSDRVG